MAKVPRAGEVVSNSTTVSDHPIVENMPVEVQY
jgi:hypothetical protein